MPDTPPPGQSWPIGFGATCLRAILYILFIAALAQGTLLEAQYLTETRFTERGFTELAQTTLLAIASALLLYSLLVLKAIRTVCLLMFAFVFASLVREQDALLDARVFDGAWQLLVALVILPTLAVVIRLRRRLLIEFSRYSNSFSFGLFAAGVLTTYVFSRLYGRSEMWEAIMAAEYTRTFKDAAEEVVEMFGYALILMAVIELTLLARRWALARKTG